MNAIQVASLAISLAAMAFSIWTTYRIRRYQAQADTNKRRLEKERLRQLELLGRQSIHVEGSAFPKSKYHSQRDLETR